MAVFGISAALLLVGSTSMWPLVGCKMGYLSGLYYWAEWCLKGCTSEGNSQCAREIDRYEASYGFLVSLFLHMEYLRQ